MKKTFTDEQIVGIFHGFEASGLTIKEYGEQYRVCYNPNDLADSSLHSLQDADCGSGLSL